MRTAYPPDKKKRGREIMKTAVTKKLEALLANHFDRRKDFFVFECKSARRRDLKADKEVILSSMLRSMQRDRILNFADEGRG